MRQNKGRTTSTHGCGKIFYFTKETVQIHASPMSHNDVRPGGKGEKEVILRLKYSC